MRGRHGGYAAQATKRGEQLVGCTACGQRVHPRPFHQASACPAWCDITSRHSHVEPEERMTPLRLLGLVIFALGMWAVLLYALPVVMIGFFGGAV